MVDLAPKKRGRPFKDRSLEIEPKTQTEAQNYAEAFVAHHVKDYLDILHDMAMGTIESDKDRRIAIETLLERGLGKAGVTDAEPPMAALKDVLLAFAEVNKSAVARELGEEDHSRSVERTAGTEERPEGGEPGGEALVAGDSSGEGPQPKAALPDPASAGDR